MHQVNLFGRPIPAPAYDVLLVAATIIVTLILHAIAIAILRRIAKHSSSRTDDVLVTCALGPLRWIMLAVALAFIRPMLHLADRVDAIWQRAAGLIVPALVGWLFVALVRSLQRIVELRADITVADNLAARRRRTRSAILGRIAIFVIGTVTICLMLLSIPSVRSVGITLMASAGIVGLAVGAAAQPALKNLIAGIQMAFTEPIRIDDAVIIDGEFGHIEEIRLTYVVVALWDQRRLIVPVSKFLEEPFQNWTRTESALIGAALFYLDPTTDLDRLRAKFEEIVRADANWDGRTVVMQVTDIKEQTIEVRALVSAADSGKAFNLRAAVREKLMAFIRDHMPEALPRRRAEISGVEARPAR